MEKKFTFKIDKKPKKGTYCLRCGMDKKEILKEKFDCGLYGRVYDKHIYK